jgi:aspartate racemase
VSERVRPPTIGILAGMGPASTGPFVDRVVAQCRLQYGAKDDLDFPRMMIYSLPTPFYADRPVDHAAMASTLREGLRELERAGVDFVGIACNSAHVYFPELARSVRVPVLNMVEIALDVLPADARTIALLAARPTCESGIYQRGARARGREVVGGDWQARIDELLESLRDGASAPVLAALCERVVHEAEATGADTLLVACADLSALRGMLGSGLRVADATECLARELVRQWRGRGGQGDSRHPREVFGG